jgi:O-antigen ligase
VTAGGESGPSDSRATSGAGDLLVTTGSASGPPELIERIIEALRVESADGFIQRLLQVLFVRTPISISERLLLVSVSAGDAGQVDAAQYDSVLMRAFTPEFRTPSVAPALPALSWTVAGVIAALALGWAASLSAIAAISLAVAMAAGIAVVSRPATILWILATSIFIELVRVEGTTISRVLAPIALLTFVVQVFRGRGSIRVDRPLFWVGAYSVWALASGLWTTSVSGTAYLLGSLTIALIYMLAFASLLESERDLERVLYVFALTSVVLGTVSWLAFSGKIHLAGATEGGRAQGEVGDPSVFAAFQLLVLPLLLVLTAQAQKRWLRLGLSFGVLIIIGSILVSLSRGGLIAFALFLVLLVVLPARFLFRSRRSKTIALLVVALATAAVSVRYSQQITHRVQTVFGKGPAGAQRGSGRYNLWLAARTTIDEHPVLGIGYGAFPYVSNDLMLRTPGVDLRGYFFRKPGQPVHNSFLEAWAELGIFGMILYVGMLTSTVLALLRTAARADRMGAGFIRRVAYALALGLTTWFVTSFFLSTETSRGFWIVIGLALALPKLLDEASADVARNPKESELAA